jgi:hypothetical protein
VARPSAVVCNRGIADWIVERPGGPAPFPLAAFGTLKFANLGFKGSDVTGNFIDMIDKGTDAGAGILATPTTRSDA